MKLYLAGPMTGIDEHNYPAFRSTAQKLRTAGYEIVSPAELHEEAESFGTSSGDYKTYLREDLAALAQCDGLALMGGFAHSNGAIWEIYSALLFNIPCYSIVYLEHENVELRELSSDVLWKFVAFHASNNGGRLNGPYTDVWAERQNQDDRWGEQNHDNKTWLAILAEEVGEVSQAILHDEFGGKAAGTVRAELVQCAAVSVAWIECIDRSVAKEQL